ncbi:peptidase C14 [Colletotrichum orchidophilum]|uniref:Peptidase C14 n=1 Tax=Colletotrichum orchidophilum TaxID=1209926 RepID=A0A1G4AMW2_9PEZI|nr:peptidase C14 [Colletotrichum orchidophilum]OHE90436.1 peptidase C14 [Colletotrichum orchidophilum]
MLPSNAPRARIFTCDWPAALFNEAATIQLTANELARKLLHGIETRDPVTDRPILFVASCLGGIVLSKALIMAAQEGSGFTSLWAATGGVIFLATPFRGTAFQEVARHACLFLQGSAKLSSKRVTTLLDSVEASTPFLQDLVGEFTSICRSRGDECRLAIFYETEKGNLLRKVLPTWAADFLKRPQQLVDSGSARLDIVTNPIALERNHVMMNKFPGQEDADYKAVARKISSIIKSMREGRPIDRADTIIREKCYAKNKLRVERLSGKALSEENCYINLAIIQRPGNSAINPQTEQSKNSSSPFSLNARLNIERPEKEKEMSLPTLFDGREGIDGVKDTIG